MTRRFRMFQIRELCLPAPFLIKETHRARNWILTVNILRDTTHAKIVWTLLQRLLPLHSSINSTLQLHSSFVTFQITKLL